MGKGRTAAGGAPFKGRGTRKHWRGAAGAAGHVGLWVDAPTESHYSDYLLTCGGLTHITEKITWWGQTAPHYRKQIFPNSQTFTAKTKEEILLPNEEPVDVQEDIYPLNLSSTGTPEALQIWYQLFCFYYFYKILVIMPPLHAEVVQ